MPAGGPESHDRVVHLKFYNGETPTGSALTCVVYVDANIVLCTFLQISRMILMTMILTKESKTPALYQLCAAFFFGVVRVRKLILG